MRGVVDAGDHKAEEKTDGCETCRSPEKPSKIMRMQVMALAPEEYQQGAIYAENRPGRAAGYG